MAGDGAKRTTDNSSSQPVATKVKLFMKTGNVNGKVVVELKWKANEKVCANPVVGKSRPSIKTP
jgi:hypothetical protein